MTDLPLLGGLRAQLAHAEAQRKKAAEAMDDIDWGYWDYQVDELSTALAKVEAEVYTALTGRPVPLPHKQQEPSDGTAA